MNGNSIPGAAILLTTTAANTSPAITSRVRCRCDAAAVDDDISSGTAVSSTATTAAANTCASGISCTLSGDRTTIYLDGTTVAAISRAGGAAANTCAAIPARRTTGRIDHAAMNGDAAAIKGGCATADARAGVFVAVNRAGGRQRPGAVGLDVDGQAVAGRHHNALCRCEVAAVRQDQVHRAGDGDGFGNGDGAADCVPARSPCDRLGAVFNEGTGFGLALIGHLAAVPGRLLILDRFRYWGRVVGPVQRPLQLVAAGKVDLLLLLPGQLPIEGEDLVKLPPYILRIILRHFIWQGGDQVLDGADTALIPAGLAGVGLGIAALAVMSVLAVQQVFRIRANLVGVAAVRVREYPQGVALVRMLMAAGLTLAGGDVAALLRMRRVVLTEGGVRFRRQRPCGTKAQAQGQSGDDADNPSFHSVLPRLLYNNCARFRPMPNFPMSASLNR